ncbi:11330_t:CDS:2, partial [Dentiscutata heterogama]
SMEFKIYVNDPTFNASDYLGLPYATLSLIVTVPDIGYAEYVNSVFLSHKDLLGSNSRFINTIDVLNTYAISVYNSYKFKLTRRRKDIMLPSWENFMGFSSKLLQLPYYTSSMETFPLLNDTPGLFLKMTIEQPTYTVQVETDKRTKTKYGCGINRSVQAKLKDNLEYIPLVNRPKSTSLNNYELKRRLDSLQLFLTEYVVDVRYFEGIYKTNTNKHKK